MNWRRTVSGYQDLSGGRSRLFRVSRHIATLVYGVVESAPKIAEPVSTGLPQRGFSHRELKQAEQGR